MQNSSLLFENLGIFLSTSAIAIIISWIAYLKKYYHLPFHDFDGVPVRFRDVVTTFLIFLFAYIIFAPLILKLLMGSKFFAKNRAVILALLQISIFCLTAGFIFLYNIFQDSKVMLRIWKDWEFPGARQIGHDIKEGLLTWVISLPVVIAIAHLSEMFILLFWRAPKSEQLAVEYLKLALASPLSLTVALFSIVIAAPLLEEYLFRGILQSWLRTKLGAKKSIFITAILFAFFHYSPSQSITNISLIITLFSFALYLGFVYEKSRSLISSIVLHVTFNSLSVIRIILMES